MAGRGRFRIANRKNKAPIHRSATVPQATSDARTANTSVDVETGVGTKFRLLTAACITIVSSRLPRVRQYSHAIATESAVTLNRYGANGWP